MVDYKLEDIESLFDEGEDDVVEKKKIVRKEVKTENKDRRVTGGKREVGTEKGCKDRNGVDEVSGKRKGTQHQEQNNSLAKKQKAVDEDLIVYEDDNISIKDSTHTKQLNGSKKEDRVIDLEHTDNEDDEDEYEEEELSGDEEEDETETEEACLPAKEMKKLKDFIVDDEEEDREIERKETQLYIRLLRVFMKKNPTKRTHKHHSMAQTQTLRHPKRPFQMERNRESHSQKMLVSCISSSIPCVL